MLPASARRARGGGGDNARWAERARGRDRPTRLPLRLHAEFERSRALFSEVKWEASAASGSVPLSCPASVSSAGVQALSPDAGPPVPNPSPGTWGPAPHVLTGLCGGPRGPHPALGYQASAGHSFARGRPRPGSGGPRPACLPGLSPSSSRLCPSALAAPSGWDSRTDGEGQTRSACPCPAETPPLAGSSHARSLTRRSGRRCGHAADGGAPRDPPGPPRRSGPPARADGAEASDGERDVL